MWMQSKTDLPINERERESKNISWPLGLVICHLVQDWRKEIYILNWTFSMKTCTVMMERRNTYNEYNYSSFKFICSILLQDGTTGLLIGNSLINAKHTLNWVSKEFFPGCENVRLPLRVRQSTISHGKKDSSSDRDTGVSVLGSFKLDHLQPVELILF